VRTYQLELVELIQKNDLSAHQNEILSLWKSLPARLQATLFVDIAFLRASLKFLEERYWLTNNAKENKSRFGDFAKKYFKKELAPVLYLHSMLETMEFAEVERLNHQLPIFQKIILTEIEHQKKDSDENFVFANMCIKLMSDHFEHEYELNIKNAEGVESGGLSLDRTFDILDEVFSLDYRKEVSETAEVTDERIYHGSGIGVQSSYSTILLSLRYLKISPNSRFVDLGSGYGRVGLVVGLMRKDIEFTGFEFVKDRVDIANCAAEKFNIANKVRFLCQDLSSPDFKIPIADVYYLFDPFTDETYQHVLTQLTEIAAQKKITIITKGNAKEHFMTKIQSKTWSKPQVFNQGNFCLFRSF
jgi:hypothetical protein